MSSLRETIPLETKKIIKKSISGTIGLLLLAGLLSIFLGFFLFVDIRELKEWPAILVAVRSVLRIALPILLVLLFSWNPFYHYLYWKRYFYDIDDKNIIIRKGVIAQKEITLPFSRITDVYVDQDILDVMFGLYDVHISTPTEQSGQFAHIDGINKEGSHKIRQMILDRMNREER